jgi:hypothetical protein
MILGTPLGAHKDVSDFRTMKDNAGELLTDMSQRFRYLRANEAINRGDVLMLVVPTATVPLSVARMATTADFRLFAGVANESASAGHPVQVQIDGICEVNVGAGTSAFGHAWLAPSATAGVAVATATDPDATAIVGSVFGVFLAAKDANNLAPAMFNRG